MMHKSISEWQEYVRNELLEEEREVYENHLYTCDQCLEVYVQAVALCEAELPTITNETELVDQIMAKFEIESTSFVAQTKQNSKEVSVHTIHAAENVVSLQTKRENKRAVMQAAEKKRQKDKRFYESTAFHYVLATALTLLLMASGVFPAMMDVADAKEQPKQIERVSFTEGLLNKTFTLMDEIDEKLKEEPQRINKNESKQKNMKEVGR